MERIGKYEIQALIGRGGFGRVYRAWDPAVGRVVAVKVLLGSGGIMDGELLQRFRLEASATGALRHPNIVTVFDYGEHESTPYLAMEFLEGRDLQKHAAAGGLSLLDRVSIMEQTAAGLQHAHHHGIVHRDVKPANIMILDTGAVKIMDFGIARLTDEKASGLTMTGHAIGTVAYMAPEQLRGRAVDQRADIFAFGVVFYELVAGAHPFRNDAPDALASRILSHEPPRLAGVPAALDRLIAQALAKDPAARYQSFEDLLFDLAPVRRELAAAYAGPVVIRARASLAAGQTEEAWAIVREVLRHDAHHPGARALREELQALSRSQPALAVPEPAAAYAPRWPGRWWGAPAALVLMLAAAWLWFHRSLPPVPPPRPQPAANVARVSASLRVDTNLASGWVALDGVAQGSLEGGEYLLVLNEAGPGEHLLEVASDEGGRARVRVQLQRGGAVTFGNAEATPDLEIDMSAPPRFTVRRAAPAPAPTRTVPTPPVPQPAPQPVKLVPLPAPVPQPQSPPPPAPLLAPPPDALDAEIRRQQQQAREQVIPARTHLEPAPARLDAAAPPAASPDVPAILHTLNSLRAAYAKKDAAAIARLYPTVPKSLLSALKRDIDTLDVQFRVEGSPQLDGAVAVVHAQRTVATWFKGERMPQASSGRVTITLRRSAGGAAWVVESMR